MLFHLINSISVAFAVLKLLDDGSGRDPLEVYNFGKAANFLFRPCQNEDGMPDEECNIHFDSGKVSLTDEERETIDFIKKGTMARSL